MNKLIDAVIVILMIVGIGCVGHYFYKEYVTFDYTFNRTYTPINDKDLAYEVAQVLVDNAKDYFNITGSDSITRDDYNEFVTYCDTVYNTEGSRSMYTFKKFCTVYIIMLINMEYNTGIQNAAELIIKEDPCVLAKRIAGLMGYEDAKEVEKYVNLKNNSMSYKIKKLFS